MRAFLFGLIAGSAFILLGRWMYNNPKKVYPNWLYSDPDSPLLKNFVKLSAMLFILVGSFAALGAIAALLLPEGVVLFFTLPSAIAATWYLRPRPPETPLAKGDSSAHEPRQKTSFLSKKGKWVAGISVGLAVAFSVGVFYRMGHSEVCQLAIQHAQSSPIAAQRLGRPVKQGLIVSGRIEVAGPSGRADVAIPISGPKGKGTLYAVAVKSAGLWKFENLQLAVDGDVNRIDLLTEPVQQTSPIHR